MYVFSEYLTHIEYSQTNTIFPLIDVPGLYYRPAMYWRPATCIRGYMVDMLNILR